MLKCGLKPPSEKRKFGIVAPVEPQRQVAGERVDQDVRIVERAVDRELLGAEVDECRARRCAAR